MAIIESTPGSPRLPRTLEEVPKPSRPNLLTFQTRTNNRVLRHLRQARKHEAKRKKKKPLPLVDIGAFETKTKDRIKAKLASEEAAAIEASMAAGPSSPASLRRFNMDSDELQTFCKNAVVERFTPSGAAVGARVAVVGAGPAGLFFACLLMARYTKVIMRKLVRDSGAPRIDLFEKRADTASHMSRTGIWVFLSPATLHLLAKHGCAGFTTPSPLGMVERGLYEYWTKALHGSPAVKRDVTDPRELLLEGYNTVIWAAGRNSLADEVAALATPNLSIKPGKSDRSLIFSFQGVDERNVAAAETLSVSAQNQFGFRAVMRPGSVPGEGWLWVIGIDSSGEVHPDGLSKAKCPFGGFGEALKGVGGPAKILEAMEEFGRRLKPDAVGARWVDAGYWSANAVVSQFPDVEGQVVLIGDAACGKPFHTGTTLNGHLQDCVALAYEADWSLTRPGPLGPYEQKIRSRVQYPEFKPGSTNLAAKHGIG